MTSLNAPTLWLDQFHWPAADHHKYHRGHVLVWGGVRMVGAARLAARAAARVGAGLVTLVVPERVWPVYAAHLMSGMAHPLPDDSAPELLPHWQKCLQSFRWQALVLGPGAAAGWPGDARAFMRDLVLAALGHEGEQTLVLDADALTAFEGAETALADAVKRSGHRVIMTPHAGEFERLFRVGPMPDGEARADLACRAAAKMGAVMVLKGPRTVVAHPDGRVVVQPQAPAWLATGGSGDVLAGLVAGLCAQGMSPMDAACMGVWLHAACGDAAGPGLLSEDLPEQVPACLRVLKPC